MLNVQTGVLDRDGLEVDHEGVGLQVGEESFTPHDTALERLHSAVVVDVGRAIEATTVADHQACSLRETTVLERILHADDQVPDGLLERPEQFRVRDLTGRAHVAFDQRRCHFRDEDHVPGGFSLLGGEVTPERSHHRRLATGGSTADHHLQQVGHVATSLRINVSTDQTGVKHKTPDQGRVFYGAPGRIRTYDFQLRKLTLYPTELQAHMR